MKIAIAAPEDFRICNLEVYIPPNADEIVFSGEGEILTDVEQFAKIYGFKLNVFYKNPQYSSGAWIFRNMQMAKYADKLIAFWDSKTRDTEHIIDCFKELEKEVKIINI